MKIRVLKEEQSVFNFDHRVSSYDSQPCLDIPSDKAAWALRVMSEWFEVQQYMKRLYRDQTGTDHTYNAEQGLPCQSR